MNINIVLIEIIISFWYLKDIIHYETDQIFMLIIVLLGYLSFKMLYYIFWKKSFGKLILLGVNIYVVLMSTLFIGELAVFFVMTLCQLLFLSDRHLSGFSIFGLVLLAGVDLPVQDFLLISMLSLIGTLSILRSQMKVIALEEKLEDKRVTLNEMTDKQVNTTLYKANLDLTTRLEERQLIAQKLHDELGHTLSGSTMQLEAALLVLEHDKDKATSMFQQVIKSLRQGTESIRQILKQVKPDNASLNIETLKTLALQVKEKSGIDVRLDYDSDINELTIKQWQVIHLNVQEALTNMMKYSGASLCKVEIKQLNHMIRIMIHDNGIGCAKVIKGMGLEGMDERLVTIGGKLITDGSDGFSLIMLLPIEKG